MKKVVALILAVLLALSAFGALAATEKIPINKANFPDKVFRGYVKGADYDRNEDGFLSASEITKTTDIELTDCEIKNLTGIQYFTNVRRLTVGVNKLKKLDVSKNTKLVRLICVKNILTKITLGKQKYLSDFDCSKNKGLKKLDISGCKKLLNIFKKGKKSTNTEDGWVQWKINSSQSLRIPKTCKLYNGNKVLYEGQ